MVSGSAGETGAVFGPDDIESLESAVTTFRALDYRHGGGAVRAALDVLSRWTGRLRDGSVPERLRGRLCTALADLHNLLGWTEFDVGRADPARRHFDRAAELAAEAGNDDLIANVCYRLGRLHLHHQEAGAALAVFGRGQAAARRAGSPLAKAILFANQAWAYAVQADAGAALAHLGRAADEFAIAEPPPPPWAAFFDENDLAAMTGTVLAELGRSANARYAAQAIPSLTAATAGYGPEMARSRSLTLILLALSHALEHDLAESGRVVDEAIETARSVQSVRTKDRLEPIEAVVGVAESGRAGQALLERIEAFRAEPLS